MAMMIIINLKINEDDDEVVVFEKDDGPCTGETKR